MHEDFKVLYLSYLESNNKSDKTVSQYSKEIEQFGHYLAEKKINNLDEVETLHVDLYQSMLMKKNKSATVVKKISIIRNFFKFLHSRKYIANNPTEAMTTVKIKDIDRKRKYALTEKEAEKLINAVWKNSIPSLKLRNQLIIMSFLYLGLRVSELCDLKIKNINLKEKTVYVHGKGGKIREVPLDDFIIKKIREYIKGVRNKERYFFVKKGRNEKMEQRAVLDLVKRHGEKSGIKKELGCHLLRRTSATLYASRGVNVRTIQRFLGHENIGTTEIYLQEDIELMKDEIRKNNPLSKRLKSRKNK